MYKIFAYQYRNFCKTALKKVFFMCELKNEKLLIVAISQ